MIRIEKENGLFTEDDRYIVYTSDVDYAIYSLEQIKFIKNWLDKFLV